MDPRQSKVEQGWPGQRSYLFVPGNRPDLVEKARSTEADSLILDLEDSIADEEKENARMAVASVLTEYPAYVRINGPTTSYFDEDLAALAEVDLAGVVLPKTETPEQITATLRRLPTEVKILPLIETAYGLLESRVLASASRVARLIFGSVDFAHDAGIEGDGEELLYARSALVIASRAARIPAPIDGVTTAIYDSERLTFDVARSKRLGFGAKLCIHPSQVDEVNRGFAPTEEEVAWANRVLEATQAGGVGVTEVGGQMIDRPVIERAKALAARARSR